MAIDIFGIGGAFMDLTFHVPDSSLVNLGVCKAGISFVSSTRQRQIIQNFHSYPFATSHGGSVANSIYTAQRLGVRCAFASKIGKDSYGLDFSTEITRYGIQLASELAPGETNTILVFITPDGEKTFVVSPELAGTLNFADIRKDILAASRWLLTEGQLFTYGEQSKQAALDCIRFAKKQGIRVALNLGSISVVEKSRAAFCKLVDDGDIDLIIGNRDEYVKLLPGASSAEVLDHIGKRSQYAVMTAGPEWAEALHAGERFRTSEIIIRKAIDSSGAGDAFLGALLACMNQDTDFQLSLDVANQVAAEVVTQPGARLSAVSPEILKRLSQGTR